MAKTPEKITRLKKPRIHCYFSCCFGVSQKEKFSEKISSPVNNKSGNIRKDTITGIFPWSMSRLKNSSAKTVPLDTSDKVKDLSEIKIPSSSKSSSNFKSKLKIHRLFAKPTDSTTKAMPFRQVARTIVNEIIEETTQGQEQEQNKTLGSRQSFDQVDTSKDATCRKRLSFCRKKDAMRTRSSQPKPNPARTNTAATSSNSVSTAVPTHEKRAKPPSNPRVGPTRTIGDDNAMVNNKKKEKKKFDPVVGMSIIVVTLIIMLVWGRLCAILCTSAWLYFVPRLKTLERDIAMMKINGDDLDLNSYEYKKRVVLEGFLGRDHRSVL